MWMLLSAALAAEPCLDRECLYCLLGEPSTGTTVQPAIARYALNAYSDELFGARGVALGVGADGTVTTVTHLPATCASAGCIGGVPFDLSHTSDTAAVEAALPGGAWATQGGRTRWSATRGELAVTVQVDDAGRVQRVEVRPVGSLDPVRAAWCRDGAWPGLPRGDGAPVSEPADRAPIDTQAALASIHEAWAQRFRSAPEGSAEHDLAWSMVEATDALSAASRNTLTSVDWLAESADKPSNAAMRETYLNARVELQSTAWNLGKAANHLRRAIAHAERGGLDEERQRLADHLLRVEALGADVQSFHDDTPSPDVLAISKTEVAPLLPAIMAHVLRLDLAIGRLGLAP